MTCNLEIKMNSAIILAGGSSNRLSSNIPKQFIKASNGKKIIDFSIEAFEKNQYIDELFIVLPEIWIEQFRNEYKDYKLVIGGDERYKSSKKGLLACSRKSRNIILHDAARPLITQKLINNCINYLKEYDAAAPFIDVNDSLIMKNDVVQYLDRDKIKLIQTPQAFNKKILMSAITNMRNDISDDMSAVLDYNKDTHAKFFQGDIYNFKITHDLDIKIFNEIINEE